MNILKMKFLTMSSITKSYIYMLKLKEYYNKIPCIFKNKFFIVGFGFIIWISFR